MRFGTKSASPFGSGEDVMTQWRCLECLTKRVLNNMIKAVGSAEAVSGFASLADAEKAEYLKAVDKALGKGADGAAAKKGDAGAEKPKKKKPAKKRAKKDEEEDEHEDEGEDEGEEDAGEAAAPKPKAKRGRKAKAEAEEDEE